MSSPRPPLGLLLKQVQQALRSDVEQALAGSGLTLPQVAVLSALRLRPGQSSAELASTTPNGHAPDRKPYALERRQPAANAAMNTGWRRSSAYMTIMKPRAQIPNSVIAFTLLTVPERRGARAAGPDPLRSAPW